VIALIEFVEGFDHAAGRIQQPLAAGIFTDVTQQRMHRGFGLGARRPRLIGADGGPPGIRTDRVRPGVFSGATSGALLVRRDLINASMSSPFDRPFEDRSVTGQTGRFCRRAPESPHFSTTGPELASNQGSYGSMAGLYFRHCCPYIGR